VVLVAVEGDTVHDEKFKDLMGRYRAHHDIADCHATIADQPDNCYTRALDIKALAHTQLAIKYNSTDYDSLVRCIGWYHDIAQWDPAEDDATSERSAKRTEILDVPTSEECYQRVIQLARDINDTLRDNKHTNFIHTLMKFSANNDEYYHILSKAARETGQLDWLQGRYRAATSAAKKDLQPVTTTCLNLCLADMIYKHGDQDVAMSIWETVGLQSSQTIRVQTEIEYAIWEALNRLGMHCVVRACEDRSQADKWVGRMERIVARSHRRR
jgi:hypothetical protein